MSTLGIAKRRHRGSLPLSSTDDDGDELHQKRRRRRPRRWLAVASYVVSIIICMTLFMRLWRYLPKSIRWGSALPLNDNDPRLLKCLQQQSNDTIYANSEEQELRRLRFPTVDDRIKLYMSHWHRKPCDDDQIQWKAHSHGVEVTERGLEHRRFRIHTEIQPARLVALDPYLVQACARGSVSDTHMPPYCQDIWMSHQVIRHDDTTVPLFFQFGDAKESWAPPYKEGERALAAARDDPLSPLLPQPQIPHLKKFRYALTKERLRKVLAPQPATDECIGKSTLTPLNGDWPPIVWKLNTKRHFRIAGGKPLSAIFCLDVSWEEKMDRAVFRGKLTGNFSRMILGRTDLSDADKCRSLPRCNLCLQNASRVDARLTDSANMLPPVIEGVPILATDKMSVGQLLRYKGLIVLEGNDVSSGLKWALLSQSVVLMPPPVYTSWAMEEWLEPWIHYIPLRADLQDVDEKVEWMLQHDSEAQRISWAGTLFIKDLLLHPEAASDDEAIFRGIYERYKLHFRKVR